MNVNEEISRRRIPCGPVTVSADGVCRRRLRDIFDKLLDRLSAETSQEYKPPQAPKDHTIDDGKVVHNDAAEAETAIKKKKEMFENAKTRAEARAIAKTYEEKLMGNSKLLQDISGKIKKR